MTNPKYEKLKAQLQSQPKTWAITGVAGFIGSNLLERLLLLDQRVVGLDNFSAGLKNNLVEVERIVGKRRWKNFRFIEGDICRPADCQSVSRGANLVLHQAALGSVPRSILEPLASHESNVTGFLNMLLAAREAKVQRFVYASSSAIYGDHPGLPAREEKVGRPLSPYAVTKKTNEIYADVFGVAYGFPSIGLRYFNVFGPRQDPAGAYAAVIPKWIAELLKREPVIINGDGQTSRDFCYVENVVQANLLAATTQNPTAIHQAYNIAVGERTTLNELFALLQNGLKKRDALLPKQKPVYRAFRAGDVRRSMAAISKAKKLLGYRPTHLLKEGLEVSLDWYRAQLS